MKRKRFWTWLKEQARRDDPIGDLASDALRSPPSSRSARGLREHMTDRRAHYAALRALDDAEAEWVAEVN